MNEADPSPINLDELRMLPDWLREEGPPPSKQYATHDYPLGDERGTRRDGGRSGGFGGRGDRRDAPRGAGGPPDRRRDGGGGGRSGPPSHGGSRGPRDERPPATAPQPYTPPALAPVRVVFLPDDKCLASINKQIRTTHLAYPLFGLARMFLQEPERHSVQFTVAPDAPAGTQLFQLGEAGPVTLDRGTLEKMAFDSAKDHFYTEQTVQKEPLKGNFTNVARERLSGALLGPTNYHAYQPALRSLYEARYSRRMSFEDFRRNVEVSTDPALIERWKEEARTITTISTVVPEGETPIVLNTIADARMHFREHHLDALVRNGTTLQVHGSVARKLPEASMMQAIRESHEREMRYPAQFVQLLRQGLQNSGLHIFKHRKRVVYVSLARPTPFVAHGAVSPSLAAILETIAQSPLCTRKALAERVIAKGSPAGPVASAVPVEPVAAPVEQTAETAAPPLEAFVAPTSAASPSAADDPAAEVVSTSDSTLTGLPTASISAATPELPTIPPVESVAPALPTATGGDPSAKAKAALASDLRFLVQSGHIIEFHNGTFDLPLPPRAKEDGPTPVAATGKPKTGGRQVSPGQPESPVASSVIVSSDETSPGVDGTVFAASGAGVDESLADSKDGELESAPSLLEVREPAPTEANLAQQAPSAPHGDERDELTSIEILPREPRADGEIPPDKTDHDGLISGPAAAPLDLPVPGDNEDAPDSRS